MFAAHKKSEEINLLPQSGLASTTSGRVLAWMLSTFRIIVIVTEILVMVAFLSRFWLDAKNSDLNDQLEQKKKLLETSRDFEQDLAEVHRRIDIYSQYSLEGTPFTDNLSTLTKFLPPDVVLNEIIIEEGILSIQGFSPNERSIQQVIANLQSNEQFDEVQLEEMKSDSESEELIIFNLSAKII